MTDERKSPTSDLAKQLSSMQEQVRRATEGINFSGISKDLAAATSGFKDFGDLQQRLHDQNRRLADMRELIPPPQPLRMPDLPPNPAFETNERLGRIEGQFEEMQKVLIEAAQIATTIQGHAAQFLGSFEKASIQTDRSASRAIWVGLIAIVIAVATPFLQAVVDRYVFPDDSAAELKAKISDVGTEQVTASQSLADRLNANSASETAILRDISRILEKHQQAENGQVDALQKIGKILQETQGK